MNQTIMLSTVSGEFGPLRTRLARLVQRTKQVYVRHQADFAKRGVSTLRELAEEIEASEVVLHAIGAKTGAMPEVADVEELLAQYPDLESRLPDVAADARKQLVSYTQWEAWLALLFNKRLCCYDLINNPTADDEDETKRQQASQRHHRDRLENQKPAVHSKTVKDDDELYDEMLISLVELKLITKQYARQPINLPYRPLGDLFKGRGPDLADLQDSLGELSHGRPTAITGKTVHGLGGVGKTRLAVEYAWQNVDRYSALLFVVADSPTNLRQNLAALTAPEVLNLPEHAAPEEDIRVAAAADWLASKPGWLLILDNADDAQSVEAVEKLLSRLRGGHVLITSRWSSWGHEVRPLELPELAVGQAAAFLLQRTEPKSGGRGRRRQDTDEADARALAEALGGLALALEQAGAYIARMRKSLAEYSTLWQQRDAAVQTWHDEREMKYPRSVAATWQTTLEQLDPAEIQLLNILAWFAPDPIPLSIFLSVNSVPLCFKTAESENTESTEDTEQQEEHSDADRIHESLATLSDFSMIRWDAESDTVMVHRVVQEILRNQQNDTESYLATSLNVLNEASPTESYDVRTWPVLDPLRPHLACVAHLADKAGIHEPTTRIMAVLAELLVAKALYQEAEPFHRRALAINEQSYGDQHPRVALHLNNLAQLLKATNSLAEAEPLMRRALAIDEQSYGDQHPDVARDLNNLASLLKATNRLAEAEPLMRRALAIDEQSYGAEHPRVAGQLNNLAQLLHSTNRLEEAEPLMRRALAILIASLGEDHPTSRTVQSNYDALQAAKSD